MVGAQPDPLHQRQSEKQFELDGVTARFRDGVLTTDVEGRRDPAESERGQRHEAQIEGGAREMKSQTQQENAGD